MHVARESWMGGHPIGIGRGVFALVDWFKRRRAAKHR